MDVCLFDIDPINPPPFLCLWLELWGATSTCCMQTAAPANWQHRVWSETCRTCCRPVSLARECFTEIWNTVIYKTRTHTSTHAHMLLRARQQTRQYSSLFWLSCYYCVITTTKKKNIWLFPHWQPKQPSEPPDWARMFTRCRFALIDCFD